MRTTTGSVDAARSRAEAFFNIPKAGNEIPNGIRTAEDAVRDRTAKLREARLAKEAQEREAARAAKPAPRRRSA